MPNNLLRSLTVALTLGIVPSLAYADAGGDTQPSATPAGVMPPVCAAESTQGAKLQCLTDEDTLVTAEQKLAEDEQKLASLNGASDTDSDAARKISIPDVPLIYGGVSSPLTAVLAYTDGRTLTVHAGETVPGGFVVQSISTSPFEVILTHNGKPIYLLMGAGGASSVGATDDNTQPQQPPGAAMPTMTPGNP